VHAARFGQKDFEDDVFSPFEILFYPSLPDSMSSQELVLEELLRPCQFIPHPKKRSAVLM